MRLQVLFGTLAVFALLGPGYGAPSGSSSTGDFRRNGQPAGNGNVDETFEKRIPPNEVVPEWSGAGVGASPTGLESGVYDAFEQTEKEASNNGKEESGTSPSGGVGGSQLGQERHENGDLGQVRDESGGPCPGEGLEDSIPAQGTSQDEGGADKPHQFNQEKPNRGRTEEFGPNANPREDRRSSSSPPS